MGIHLDKNHENGIEAAKFAELVMSSGLVCNEDVTWVTFHGAYDLGFLVKLLSGRVLPDHLHQFMDLVKAYFGDDVYDVKHLMKRCNSLYGGLDQVAKTLGLKVEPAVENCNQSGAHSLLTWKVFDKIKDHCGGGPEKFIYGLGPF